MSKPQILYVAVSGIEAAPQGSKKHVGRGRLVETCKRLKPWRRAVAEAARVQMNDQKLPIFDVPVDVQLLFRFNRPKSHFRTNGDLRPNAPKHYFVKKNDIDKITRSTLDALVMGGALKDDCLVVRLIAEKRYCHLFEPPGVLITVSTLPDRP